MILFFSDNHHTRDYFNQLITCMTEQNLSAKLYYDNKTNLPNPRFLKSLPTEAFNDALKSISQEYRILHGQDLSVSSLKRLRRQAAWKYALDMGELKRERPQLVVVWNGLKFRRSIFVKVAEELGIPILYMENGLLPNTTVCDPMGINAVNSVPRDPAFFLNREIINQDQSFSEKLTVREAKKEKRSENKVLPEHFIFVPFQVDTDTQITLFSPWIKTMRQLFEAIKALAPELPYQFVFKEHPSSPIDYSVLHDELDESIGIFANDYNTQQLIEKSEAVVTINSTVAIESILLNKRVIVLGKGFFNIEGLVLRAESELALKKAFNELPNFSVNAKLRISFLDYLKEEYLVPGSWRDATPDHLSATCERILTYYQKTQDMPTQSIFFVSTPLHLIVSLAIVDTEKVDHAHLVFIDQVSDTDNPYMTTIESWDENPFESVQCFYRPKKDMGKYKARKQLFANIEKLVIGIKPSHIYCGNDRRVEFQCAMNTAQYYDSNVQGYYMDEGTFTYTGRAASSSFSDRVIDNSIKKLAYGSWWKHPETVGASDWIQTVYVSFPEFIHPALQKKEVRQLTTTYWHSSLLQEFCGQLLDRLGRPAGLEELDVILTLPHESILKQNPHYKDALLKIVNEYLCDDKKVALKYHPRDTDPDSLGLLKEEGTSLIEKKIPFEMLLPMLKDDATVIGDFSTTLISTRLLRPDLKAMAIVHTHNELVTKFMTLYKNLDIEILDTTQTDS